MNPHPSNTLTRDPLLTDLRLLRECLVKIQEAQHHPGGPYPAMKTMELYSQKTRDLIDTLAPISLNHRAKGTLHPSLGELPDRLDAFVRSPANRPATIFPLGPRAIAETEGLRLAERGPFFSHFPHDDLLSYCDDVLEQLGCKRLLEQLSDVLCETRTRLKQAVSDESVAHICDSVLPSIEQLNKELPPAYMLDVRPVKQREKDASISVIDEAIIELTSQKFTRFSHSYPFRLIGIIDHFPRQ